MRAGAHDFILKGNFPRLVPALERELRQAKVLRERRQALEKLSVIFHEHSPTWFSNPFTQARRAELVR
jgi:hypothetical protein